jgi:hypothetical protein
MSTTFNGDPELFLCFEQIAQDHLAIDTLRTRGRDDLDFHDISVWALLDMMQAAYNAGQKSEAAAPSI